MLLHLYLWLLRSMPRCSFEWCEALWFLDVLTFEFCSMILISSCSWYFYFSRIRMLFDSPMMRTWRTWIAAGKQILFKRLYSGLLIIRFFKLKDDIWCLSCKICRIWESSQRWISFKWEIDNSLKSNVRIESAFKQSQRMIWLSMLKATDILPAHNYVIIFESKYDTGLKNFFLYFFKSGLDSNILWLPWFSFDLSLPGTS